jgi:hypothetical protein
MSFTRGSGYPWYLKTLDFCLHGNDDKKNSSVIFFRHRAKGLHLSVSGPQKAPVTADSPLFYWLVSACFFALTDEHKRSSLRAIEQVQMVVVLLLFARAHDKRRKPKVY